MRRAELDGCSDEQLLGLYSRGEMEAMEVLLARYKRPLFNFVLRLVRERGKAEDLLQESFLRMVEHAGSFQGSASVKTWLFRIARNLCIDEMRKQKHRRHPSLDAPSSSSEGEGQSLYERVAHAGPGPERSVVDRDLAQRMSKAIDELPEDQREVFVLRQVQHLSFKEIGDVTGVSENTVKSRMRYALERLQRSLSDYQEYAEELL
ncbi:MAG: RNA polymerase sigma factor [Myxococcales bacterium]